MKMKEFQFELIKKQLKKLTAIPGGFYQKKFEGIDIDAIQSQEDFEKLPFSSVSYTHLDVYTRQAQGLLKPEDAAAVRATLESYGLPGSVPLDTKTLGGMCGSDKKMDGDTLNLIVLDRSGKASVEKMSLAGLAKFMGVEG